tara:strand:+ start:2308 stop:2505 length:198 start_codon:yes stop_codon:yes gene_type:complete
MEEDDIKLVMELSLDEVRQIARSLEFHFKQWPGYPAAPKEEQEMLWHLRQVFRMAMMEVSFHSDD